MKGLLKLMPAALAVFALASCSDDNFVENVTPATDYENALFFTMENAGGNTRAGVVGNATDAISEVKFRWTKDDAIRVYDEKLAMYDVYQYTDDSFNEDTPTAAFVHPAGFEEEMLNGYSVGIYPSKQVEAVYLDKNDRALKHIEMTLPAEYGYEEGSLEKEAYRCDMPMYGNINDVSNSITQMNFMTAWTRIYMRNLPADVKYIAVVSKNAAQPLTGLFETKVHFPLNPSDEPWLKTKAAADDGTWGNIVWSKVNLTSPAALKEYAGICFPLPVQTYENLTIYGLKDAAAKTPAQVGDNMADWETLVTAGQAIKIDSRDNLNITRRKQCWTVRYTFTYYLDTDALSPFRPGEVSKVLAEQADKVIGDFEIVPYSKAYGLTPVDPTKAKVLTAGPGDYYTHRIEIPAISPLANIVLNFGGAGIKYDEALQIYDKNPETNKFSGKLTIIPGTIDVGSSTDAKIEINLPEATVYVLGENLGNVDIQNAKEVHLGDGTISTTQTSNHTTVVKGGKLYVEKNTDIQYVFAEAYAGVNPHSAEEVIVNGGKVRHLQNNTAANITLLGNGYDATAQKTYEGEALVQDLQCNNITDNINIISKGQVRINKFKAPKDMSQLTIKSTLLPKSATDNSFYAATQSTSEIYGSVDPKVAGILTAAMLAKAAADGISTDETYIMADEIDLNNLPWTGGEVSKNLTGYNHDATTGTWKKTVTTPAKTYTSSQKNVIKNLNLAASDGNGLIGELTANVAGLEINGAKFENTTATAVNNMGMLAGKVTNAANITNVKVSGMTVDSKAGNGIGGIIGLFEPTLAATVEIKNVDVTATKIEGRSFVGGIIGRVKGASPTANITDSKVNLSGLSLKLADGATTLYPNYAGTWGSFVGGTEGDPTFALTIYNGDFGTALRKAQKGKGINNQGLRFGANATSDDVPFFGGNPWIGFCGTLTGTSNTTLKAYTKQSEDAKDYTEFVYDENKMVATVYTGGYAAYTGGTNTDKYTYAGASTDSDNNTVTPKTHVRTAKYGTSIYSDYTAASLKYDNSYVEKTGVR